ncbi:hypothetical protein [Streptomyces niveus]|uniref:Barstar (barnase inhibitor) domain-containing protein n=1 Tax=Streptomyces niveus TaxID=193462 RepID=A0ABZ1ZWI8_STRNV|nr:hypothetical protein [Streptomyces niveus]
MVDGDSSRITFKLWNPVVSIVDGQALCVLDVTTIGECLLDQGNARIMQDFLSAVGVSGVTVVRWRIQRFCTQYYSDYPERPDWRDRLPCTWRVEIGLDGEPGEVGNLGFGPFGVAAWDSTFADEDRDWIRGAERCLIIVEADRDADLRFLREDLHCQYDVVDHSLGSLASIQITIDLGVLNLSLEIGRVDEVISACRDHGIRTRWTQTLHRYFEA